MPPVGHHAPSWPHSASHVTWATRIPRCCRCTAHQEKKKKQQDSALYIETSWETRCGDSKALGAQHKGPADTGLADSRDLRTQKPEPVRARCPVVNPPQPLPQAHTHSACCLGEFIGHLRELVIAQKAEHERIQVAGNHAAQAGVRHPPGNTRHYRCRRAQVRNSGTRQNEGGPVMTSSHGAGAQRKGRALPTGQFRLHFGGRIKAKSLSSFRCRKCRHLGKGGALRPPLCEGGALTSRGPPSTVAGKLQPSRALLEPLFFQSCGFRSRSWDSHCRVVNPLA